MPRHLAIALGVALVLLLVTAQVHSDDNRDAGVLQDDQEDDDDAARPYNCRYGMRCGGNPERWLWVKANAPGSFEIEWFGVHETEDVLYDIHVVPVRPLPTPLQNQPAFSVLGNLSADFEAGKQNTSRVLVSWDVNRGATSAIGQKHWYMNDNRLPRVASDGMRVHPGSIRRVGKRIRMSAVVTYTLPDWIYYANVVERRASRRRLASYEGTLAVDGGAASETAHSHERLDGRLGLAAACVALGAIAGWAMARWMAPKLMYAEMDIETTQLWHKVVCVCLLLIPGMSVYTVGLTMPSFSWYLASVRTLCTSGGVYEEGALPMIDVSYLDPEVTGNVTGSAFVGDSLPPEALWQHSAILCYVNSGDGSMAIKPQVVRLQAYLLPLLLATWSFAMAVTLLRRMVQPLRRMRPVRRGGLPTQSRWVSPQVHLQRITRTLRVAAGSALLQMVIMGVRWTT